MCWKYKPNPWRRIEPIGVAINVLVSDTTTHPKRSFESMSKFKVDLQNSSPILWKLNHVIFQNRFCSFLERAAVCTESLVTLSQSDARLKNPYILSLLVVFSEENRYYMPLSRVYLTAVINRRNYMVPSWWSAHTSWAQWKLGSLLECQPMREN